MIWEPSRSCEPDRTHNSCPLPNYQLCARTYKSDSETPIDVFSSVRNIFIGEKMRASGRQGSGCTIGYKSRGHSNCDASSSHEQTARPGFGQPRVNHRVRYAISEMRLGARPWESGRTSVMRRGCGRGESAERGVCSSGSRVKWGDRRGNWVSIRLMIDLNEPVAESLSVMMIHTYFA